MVSQRPQVGFETMGFWIQSWNPCPAHLRQGNKGWISALSKEGSILLEVTQRPLAQRNETRKAHRGVKLTEMSVEIVDQTCKLQSDSEVALAVILGYVQILL